MDEKEKKEFTPKERWTTCINCDKFQKPLGKCKLCGCFMKVKVNFPWAKCPAGKW